MTKMASPRLFPRKMSYFLIYLIEFLAVQRFFLPSFFFRVFRVFRSQEESDKFKNFAVLLKNRQQQCAHKKEKLKENALSEMCSILWFSLLANENFKFVDGIFIFIGGSNYCCFLPFISIIWRRID